MTIDNEDNIYLTGYLDSYIVPMADIFVLKFSSDGSLIWNQTIAWEEYDRAYALMPVKNICMWLVKLVVMELVCGIV